MLSRYATNRIVLRRLALHEAQRPSPRGTASKPAPFCRPPGTQAVNNAATCNVESLDKVENDVGRGCGTDVRRPFTLPEGSRKTAKLTSEGTNLKSSTSPVDSLQSDGQSLDRLVSIAQASSNHHDLSSFLAYAQRKNLSEDSTVYKGTHFEYTVANTLTPYRFQLHRRGRSNDLGVDLVGQWHLPLQQTVESDESGQLHREWKMRVLLQCKLAPPQPSMVRELEGMYVGAPARWRGDDVLALLVSSKAATKGVREALQRSGCPLGFIQISRNGECRQFLWNHQASRIGLEGLGVTMKHFKKEKRRPTPYGKHENIVGGNVALTWMGEFWRGPEST